jgi:sugar/nucleoside kinase (ribokinase family)
MRIFAEQYASLFFTIEPTMKDIQVCGIGHALVDIEFAIDEHTFNKLGLTKGSMSLVSEEDQAKVISTLSDKSHHRSSGGSAANTIIAIGQFGGKAAYKTILGDDAFGAFYAQEFRDLGIILDAEIKEQSKTGTCLVLITPDAERTMMTSLGVNSTYNRDHLVEDTIQRSEWLYVEGYRLTEPGGADAIKEAVILAKKHNTKIAFTYSDAFVVNAFRDIVEEISSFTDLVFCNESEAMAFTHTTNHEDAFASLTKTFTHTVMTRGKHGSELLVKGERHTIPAYATTAVDTTGAGDMYAGGFLFGLTQGYSVLRSGHLASYSSSRVVSQFGARLQESPSSLHDSIISKFA